jgi:phage terminase large subunit-like protein
MAYAYDAIEDRNGKKFNKWIRLAAKRFISDLKRAQKKRAPFVWSPDQANKACSFIEDLPHVEGVWESPNIKLHPAHVFFVVNLFGFRKADGTRRFTSALFAVARKNAKSTLAAAILIYCLCCEHEVGPQVISAATTGQQARIVFNIAKRMVEKVSDLREAFTLEPFANAIARYEVGGSFKPINAKASTQDGLNPSHVELDEIHAHKNHDLLNVLRSAAGARRNPLFLYTTTEGYENPGPWGELRLFAQQVLEQVVEAEHFLILYYSVDDKDDDFDESKWEKANPLMSVNPILKAEIRKESIEAKAMPGRLAEFQIKRLNRRAASAAAWVNILKWRKCAGAVPLAELVGWPCFGGLDLASTTDMTAWRLYWLKEGIAYTWGRYWVPEDAVKQRTERGTVPYASWIASGHITQTAGNVTDYDVVKRDVLEDWERFQPIEVGFDTWNATQISNDLIVAGVNMVQFIQGPKSFNPAMNAVERMYLAGNLRHGGDPVLTWNMANLVPRHDQNKNVAPDKKRSPEKIDGAVALFMAAGRAEASVTERSFWETNG